MSDAAVEAPPVEGEVPAEAPPAEEAPAVVEKREPEHLKTWKAAEKPVSNKLRARFQQVSIADFYLLIWTIF